MQKNTCQLCSANKKEENTSSKLLRNDKRESRTLIEQLIEGTIYCCLGQKKLSQLLLQYTLVYWIIIYYILNK